MFVYEQGHLFQRDDNPIPCSEEGSYFQLDVGTPARFIGPLNHRRSINSPLVLLSLGVPAKFAHSSEDLERPDLSAYSLEGR